MGLDTSSSVRTSAWLLSYERFHEHNGYMSVLHAKFDVKTVMNEEIPVNEWQKKIKCQSWQKCCLFYKVLKFWVTLTCAYGTSCTALCGNFHIIQHFSQSTSATFYFF